MMPRFTGSRVNLPRMFEIDMSELLLNGLPSAITTLPAAETAALEALALSPVNPLPNDGERPDSDRDPHARDRAHRVV